MFKYHFKIDYLYDGQEDFLIFSSSSLLNTDEIVKFALGARDKSLFMPKEIWELNFDKDNQLLQYSLKEKLL